MRISRLTVDKLGVKLYDRPSAVLAELVANGYDADARTVIVRAPMGRALADLSSQATSADQGASGSPTATDVVSSVCIEVEDDGIGMTPEEVNDFYLRVGAERRKDPKRGALSKVFKRRVMGRKGVGKLAPFGICHNIEILTSGGPLVDGVSESGTPIQGYLTAHLHLDRDGILKDSDDDYEPTVGKFDGTLRPTSGTLLRLTVFEQRTVPEIDQLARQLAQRFGISRPDWTIALEDNGPSLMKGARTTVGSFDVDTMPETKLVLAPDGDGDKRVMREDGTAHPDLTAGFYWGGGGGDTFCPVRGWVAYAKESYKDELMVGIRIYCNGKIAAQTSVFNRKAGFTGEHDARSYLVGELHADWLDIDEDLIQTDRRDILWSHVIGEAFEKWGQELITRVGAAGRNPMKKKTWDLFKEQSQIEDRAANAFPGKDQAAIKDKAVSLAKLIGQNMRKSEIDDKEHVEAVAKLALTFAPHITLDEKLREAADAHDRPITTIASILRTARVAELSSFGRIAEERVRVISKVEELKDQAATVEAALQKLIEEAPWLINPQWSPITKNQSFATLKSEFEKFYKERTGNAISINDFSDPKKRADFVLSTQDGVIQVIEIKRPMHQFGDDEFERLFTYVRLMREFLDSNPVVANQFHGFHVTLVCDGLALSYIPLEAFKNLLSSGELSHINWTAFLLNTRRMHEDFLREAERQKQMLASTK